MPFKVYVDSRFRQETGGSSSDSEFSVELPHPIQVKGRAFVDTVLVPNTFYVIRAGENDRFHVRENTSTYRVCTIAEGQYNAMTLKDALLTTLQTGRSMTGAYTVTYDTTTNKLIIGNLDASGTFHELMDAGSETGFATGTAILSGSVGTSCVDSDNDDSGTVLPDIFDLPSKSWDRKSLMCLFRCYDPNMEDAVCKWLASRFVF